MASALHRLDAGNITDDLIRAQLYDEIRTPDQDTKDAFFEDYTIQPDEILRPELIAYRMYAIDMIHVKWVSLVAVALDDIRDSITAGDVISLPSAVWLRRRIRHYVELEKKMAAA